MAEYDYRGVSAEMLDEDAPRDDLFVAMDDMANDDFSLPAELEAIPDIRKFVDTAPSDALDAATNTFSAQMPDWDVQPVQPGPAGRSAAEKIENAIDWHYRMANRRATGSALWEMCHHAFRYNMIAVYVNDLKYWHKGKEDKRSQAILGEGRFAINVYNPKYVHVRQSQEIIENVLLAVNKPAREVVTGFPQYSKVIEKELKASKDKSLRFMLYDLTRWDTDGDVYRTVWGNTTADENIDTSGAGEIVLMDEKMPQPFFPWAVRVGGMSSESDYKYRYRPLLGKLHWADVWTNTNIVGSLGFSEIIRRARAPVDVSRTLGGRGVKIDWTTGETIALSHGDEYTRLAPVQINPMVIELYNALRSMEGQATSARALQSIESFLGSNTPFATVNAMIQLAVSSLSRFQMLTEQEQEDIARIYLKWVEFTGEPLIFFRTFGSEAGVPGEEVVLSMDEFDLDRLFIKCHLKPATPTDLTQRINDGVMMNKQLKVSLDQVYEHIGLSNPSAISEQWMQEETINTVFANFVQQITAMTALQLRQLEGQMQMGLTAKGQVPAEKGVPSPSTEFTGGQGFNPNQGGVSPTTAAGGTMTREQVTGRTVTGEGVV